MKAWQRRLETAPLGAIFVGSTVLFFLVRTAVDAFTRDEPFDPLAMVLRLVSAALFGGLMVFIIGRQRRRSGGTTTNVEVQEAVKTGTLPDRVDASVWVPALEWRRAQLARSLWLTPVLVGLAMVLGVFILLISPAAYVGWLVIAFFLALGAFSFTQSRKMLPKVDALLHEVRQRDGADVPQTTPSDPREA